MGIRSALCRTTASVALTLFVTGSSAATKPARDAGAAPPAAADGGLDAASPEADPRTAQIRAFLEGRLPAAVDPQSLFDVPLSNDGAIRVEAVRLGRILKTEEPAPSAPAPPRTRARGAVAGAPDAGAPDAGASDVDPALWQSRSDLDRARLEFYVLPRERRAALLTAQDAKREAARPQETEVERHAREAELERAKALVAARQAHSEAERAVAQQVTRLLEVERAARAVRDDLRDEQAALATRRESLLGWRERVHDAQVGSPEIADETYDALGKTLRASRDDLGRQTV